MNKVLISAAIFSLFGLAVLAQENSSFSVVQRFPGQYNNTKFSIYLADPQGIGAAQVKKSGGDWVLSAGRSCLKEYYSGTVTLEPGDFPLSASLTDCRGNKYETSIWAPGTFPVAELGNCQSEGECRDYCEIPANAEPCLDYAEEHNLLSREEIDGARQMLSLVEGGRGPGGCRGEQECENYCDSPDNMEECIVFARDNGLLAPDELEEIEMVLQAIRQGATPPDCRGKTECDEYCSRPENLEECIEFGTAAGFIAPEEAEMIRKTGGKGPGECTGKDECETYCNEPNNMEECINFAIKYDLMPPDEAEEARMALRAIKSGVKMPNCRGKDECDTYCSQPENTNECMDFAVAAGFMTAEEAEMVKKTGGVGPGGCRGERECETFCEDQANEETCFRFGLEHGFVSEEQFAEMQRGVEEMRRNIEEAPEGVADCLKNRISPEILQGIHEGSLILLRSTGEMVGNAMESCAQEFGGTQGREAEQKVRACLAMPCSEALTCLENVSQDEQGEATGEEGGASEVQAKIESCIQEQIEQQMEVMMRGFEPSSEEETERDIMEVEPNAEGGSLDPFRLLLANISSILGF
ncbi:MAG: hypothetical protein HYT21_01355 [Candidatus Nealsonbacteria bacterium]|nr:hypothetical protein [Candidatus Nealsonbacteria bacterium]